MLGRRREPDAEPRSRPCHGSTRTRGPLRRPTRDGGRVEAVGLAASELVHAYTDLDRYSFHPLDTVFGFTSSPTVGEELVELVAEENPDVAVIDAMSSTSTRSRHSIASGTGDTPVGGRRPAPDNADLASFADHEPLMERADFVVGHGGHGTTMHALGRSPHGGDPGPGADQVPITQLIERWKVGRATPWRRRHRPDPLSRRRDPRNTRVSTTTHTSAHSRSRASTAHDSRQQRLRR